MRANVVVIVTLLATPAAPQAERVPPGKGVFLVAKPSIEGFLGMIHSAPIQVRAAAEAERWVTVIAIAASPDAESAEPPLKPNQPTQSMPVPVTVIVRLWGIMGVEP